MAEIRIGSILYQSTPDRHIVGTTTRIRTDVVAGWCGVDVTEKVGFDHYRGRLTVDVEGRKYQVKCRKPDAIKTLVGFLKCRDRVMEIRRIHEYHLERAVVWQLDCWASPDGGWVENNRFRLGMIEIPRACDGRKLCSLLRKKNMLPPASLMQVHVSREMISYGQLEIHDRNGIPILLIEFIEE